MHDEHHSISASAVKKHRLDVNMTNNAEETERVLYRWRNVM